LNPRAPPPATFGLWVATFLVRSKTRTWSLVTELFSFFSVFLFFSVFFFCVFSLGIRNAVTKVMDTSKFIYKDFRQWLLKYKLYDCSKGLWICWDLQYTLQLLLNKDFRHLLLKDTILAKGCGSVD
jgi:hypothetical protein